MIEKIKWLKKIFILNITLILISACSSLQNHKRGDPYSGVRHVKGLSSSKSSGPNSLSSAQLMLLPINIIYIPVDIIFSTVLDTIILPIDLIKIYKGTGEESSADYIPYTQEFIDINGTKELIRISQAYYSENRIKKVQNLVNNGVNINYKDYREHTALEYCVIYNHRECSRILLKAGAKFDRERICLKSDSFMMDWLLEEYGADDSLCEKHDNCLRQVRNKFKGVGGVNEDFFQNECAYILQPN